MVKLSNSVLHCFQISDIIEKYPAGYWIFLRIFDIFDFYIFLYILMYFYFYIFYIYIKYFYILNLKFDYSRVNRSWNSFLTCNPKILKNYRSFENKNLFSCLEKFDFRLTDDDHVSSNEWSTRKRMRDGKIT